MKMKLSLVFVLAGLMASGYEISADYSLRVDGRAVEVVRVPTPEVRLAVTNRHPYSYAPITAAKPVEITLESAVLDLSKARILPESKAVESRFRDGRLTFRMTPPEILVVEPTGRHRMLVLAASKPEAKAPDAKDPAVKFFGPGVHRPEKIFLKSNETLYLAPGAWVEGIVVATGDNITVCGSGVLSGAPWPWTKGPQDRATCINPDAGHLLTFRGRNLNVRDITAFSSFGWTTVLNGVTNAVIENYKIIGGRCVNDDGMDLARIRDVTVRNSFIRCQDDCIAPKWQGENLTVSNCTFMTDESNIVRIGYECDPGKAFRNYVFRDIDVLHLAMAKRDERRYWSNGVFLLQGANEATIEDVLFDRWRIEEYGAGDTFLVAKTMSIKEGAGSTKVGGCVRNVTVRNPLAPAILLKPALLHCFPCDPRHPVENVKLELNQAVTPAPRKAGGWMARHRLIAAAEVPDVVLVGDSITHFWAGRKSIGRMDDPETRDVWKETFAGLDVLDCAIAGDRTQSLLWHLDHGWLAKGDPKVIELMIGVNNSWTEDLSNVVNTPEEALVGIRTILSRLHGRYPRAEIVLSHILPTGKPQSRGRVFVEKLNGLLAGMPLDTYGGRVKRVDFGAMFLSEDGTISTNLMYDLTHPTDKGYRMLGARLRPEIDAALKRYGKGELYEIEMH